MLKSKPILQVRTLRHRKIKVQQFDARLPWQLWGFGAIPWGSRAVKESGLESSVAPQARLLLSRAQGREASS